MRWFLDDDNTDIEYRELQRMNRAALVLVRGGMAPTAGNLQDIREAWEPGTSAHNIIRKVQAVRATRAAELSEQLEVEWSQLWERAA